VFEARVAGFYRAKGYTVHENPKVRGASGNVYAAALVADGPLGALLVSFGDAGGIDGHELGRVRTMAKDIGATPVLACPAPTADVRRLAAQLGVVLVDDATVAETSETRSIPLPIDAIRKDLDAHPWPASGRTAAAGLQGGAEARDVDELIADLTRAPAAVVGAGASSALVLEPVPAPAPAVSAKPFAWLEQATVTPMAAAPSAPVNLSTLLGKPATAATTVPAAEAQVELTARTPVLQRASARAADVADGVRFWPWKTILWVAAGAVALVLLIRWFASP